MISIKGGRIYFYNTLKPEAPARDFQCISAYICPACKNVLKAYFVGYLMKESLPGFMEKDSLKYAYEVGNTNGGTWISLKLDYHSKECSWEIAGAMSRGIGNCVSSFLEINETRIRIMEAFINRIEIGDLPGFRVIPDEVGNDKPMLVYNLDEMLDYKGVKFEEYIERKKDIGRFLEQKIVSLI